MYRKTTIKNEYFNYILSRVLNPVRQEQYSTLMKLLHDKEFTWINERDVNRAADGIDLRCKFAYDKNYDQVAVCKILNGPCSVLEMMAALAIRCEDSIMGDDEYGDRTYEWFWIMIDNLALDLENNDNINEAYCEERIERVLDRDYPPDGYGSFWYIPNYDGDLKDVEIWYQMNYYLNTIE